MIVAGMKSVKASSFIIALIVAAPVIAQDQPASEASIRELMALTNTASLLDEAYTQVERFTEQSLHEGMEGKSFNPEQKKLLGEMRSKAMGIVRSELSWERLEPEFIGFYRDTFTQSEIDGINGFYKTEAGQALIAKMPKMLPNLIQLMIRQREALAPKVQALAREYDAKIEAAAK